MNVLAIGAHFDDIELGCAGALAKHIVDGDKVIIYVATKSGYTGPNNKVIRSDETAEAEGEKAASILGARLVCGGFATLNLEFTDDLNLQLVELIEKEEIDLIYTHYTGDIHHDHIALAKASLHAGRHVPRILQYHSNWYQSDECFDANFYVDVSEVWDKKVDMLKAHESEYERAGEKWLAYFKNEAQNNGFRCGVELAEGFHLVKWIVK